MNSAFCVRIDPVTRTFREEDMERVRAFADSFSDVSPELDLCWTMMDELLEGLNQHQDHFAA